MSNLLFKGTIFENAMILEVNNKTVLVKYATKDEIPRSECPGEHYISIGPDNEPKTIYHVVPAVLSERCEKIGVENLPSGVKARPIDGSIFTPEDFEILINDGFKSFEDDCYKNLIQRLNKTGSEFVDGENNKISKEKSKQKTLV